MQKHSWKPAHLRYLIDSESCDMVCGMPRSTQPLSGVLPPRSSAPSPPSTGSLPPSVAPGSWLSLDGASGIRLRRMSQLDDDVISAARPTDRPIQRMRGRRRPIVRDDVTTCCGKRRVNKSRVTQLPSALLVLHNFISPQNGSNKQNKQNLTKLN